MRRIVLWRFPAGAESAETWVPVFFGAEGTVTAHRSEPARRLAHAPRCGSAVGALLFAVVFAVVSAANSCPSSMDGRRSVHASSMVDDDLHGWRRGNPQAGNGARFLVEGMLYVWHLSVSGA